MATQKNAWVRSRESGQGYQRCEGTQETRVKESSSATGGIPHTKKKACGQAIQEREVGSGLEAEGQRNAS